MIYLKIKRKVKLSNEVFLACRRLIILDKIGYRV